MATIDEVAEKAGVSKKTVSRVLNNYLHVSEKTRNKVKSAIAELDYSPSLIARQMRTGDTLSIGVMYGDPTSGYQSQLNLAMLRACSEARRYLAVELFDEDSAQWVEQVERFLDRSGVRNLVLLPPMCDSNELHELLKSRGVRFMLVSPSRAISGAYCVSMDDRLAAMEATRYLIDHGHKRIAHIAGRDGHIGTLLRRLGFEDALKQAGLWDASCQNVISGDFRFRNALKSAEQILSAKNRPTAVFAANDQMAVATMMVAHRLGISVPDDLSIIGFDNTPISKNVWPELTTVAQPFSEIAAAAIDFFGGAVDEKNLSTTARVLPHQLLVRGSTGPAH